MSDNILVVGAGIGGLTAAIALQHFGHAVNVFEQAPQLREIGAGVVITPNAMHALNYLGVGDQVSAIGSHPGKTYCRHYATGEVLEVRPSAQQLHEKFGADYLQVHRADLHDILKERLIANDHSCLHLDHLLVSARQDADCVHVTFANGKTYSGIALIGADGNASKVRDSIFGAEQVNYTGQIAYRALIPAARVNDTLEGEDKRLYIGPGRMFLQYYIRRDEILNVIGIAREPKWQAEGWAIPGTQEEMLDKFSDFHPFVQEIIRRIPEDNLFKWGLRDREPMPVWVKGRVATLGDAAHPMTPFLGQGACMAIEDSMVLARCVAKYPDVQKALLRYEAARKERGNGVQLASREQAEALQGKTTNPNEFGPGRSPVERGLFAYNPITVEV